MFNRTNRPIPGRSGRLGIRTATATLFATMVIAIILLKILETDLAIKWVLTGAGGLILIMILFILDDPKTLLMGLLPFSSATNVNIGILESAQKGHAVFPLTIHLNDILIALLYVLWLFESYEKRSFKAKTWFLPLIFFGLFVLWTALSVTISDPAMRQGGYFLISVYLRVLMVLWYLINNICSIKHLKAILIGAVAVITLQAGQGLVQKATGRLISIPMLGGRGGQADQGGSMGLWGGGQGAEGRIEGSAKHPNALARLLSLYIPVFLFVALFYKRNYIFRAVLGAAALLAMLAVALTLSRSGWGSLYIALALGFGLIALYHKRIVEFILVAFLAHAILLAPLLITDNLISRRLFGAGDTLSEKGSAYARIFHLSIALNVIIDRPILGLGPGMYISSLRKYDDTVAQFVATYPRGVHNSFVFFATESGVPVALFFLAFFFTVFYYGFKRTTHPALLTRLVALGFVVGLVANFIALTYTLYLIRELKSIWLPISTLCAIYLHPDLFITDNVNDQSTRT